MGALESNVQRSRENFSGIISLTLLGNSSTSDDYKIMNDYGLHVAAPRRSDF